MSTHIDENRRQEEVVDLREDSLHYPVQCQDTGDSDVIAPAAQRNVADSGDFIDIQRDVRLPVQCTEASQLHNTPLSPTCVAELTVRLDILLRKFDRQAQTSLTIRTSDLIAALHPPDIRRYS